MKKHIAEELPARKHAPAAAPAGKGGEEKGGDGKKSPEKRVKQAIYDIRYRARREELPLRSAYSQYMQNSSMSAQEKTMVKQKLFGKSGGMQAEDFNIEDAASTSVANALYKVFVEGVEKEQEPIRLTYMEKLETAEHKKYKVRVTGKDGRSYVRYADRQKISELRANPNIESVEMTGYGEPYEGEKKKGEQTARAKAGKDWDGDGKEESPAKEYRGVVHNAIQKRRGGTPDGQDTSSVKEEFIGEVKSEKDDSDKKIDVMKGKNKVTLNPEAPGTSNGGRGMQLAHYDMGGAVITEKAVSKAQQRFMGMVYAAKKGETPASPEVAKAAEGMSKKEAKKYAKTKHEGLPTHKEAVEPKSGGSTPNMPAKVVKAVDELPQKIQQIFGAKKNPQKPVKEETVAQADKKAKKEQEEKDARSLPTAINLAKNYARAMGAKNPIVMVSTEEVEMIDERRREEKEAGTPRAPRDRALEIVKGAMRQQTGKPAGQRKKEPGKKPPTAGQYGAPASPAQKVAKRRAAAQRAQDNMSSRFD
jgi:hypothetical protein